MSKITVYFLVLMRKKIPLFYDEIERIRKKDFKNIEFEYIFVNDGSKDNTLNTVKELSKKDKKVRYISFSRNFGKEVVMLADLKESSVDLCYTNGYRSYKIHQLCLEKCKI